MKYRAIARGLALIATLAAGGYLVKVTGLDHMLDKAWIDAEVRGHGFSGEVLFVVIGALATAVGLPRQFISFLGGYAFGIAAGTGLGVLATLMGCATTFYYARWLGRALVMARFAAKVRRVDAFLHDNTLTMTLLIRLLPVGSNLLTNLAAGVSSVRAHRFLAGSALGFLPQTLVFATLGAGVEVDDMVQVAVSALLFVASGVLGAWLYRRLRANTDPDPELAAALGEPELVLSDGTRPPPG